MATSTTKEKNDNKIKKNEVVNLCYTDVYELDELENRHLYINAEIDDEVIDTIVYHILRYNRMDKGIPVEKRTPIVIYMNSVGGQVSSGYALIDAMIDSETPVYTVNQGLCASMGLLIFLAGQKRYSMRHSEFLLHDGSTMGFDSTAKMKDRMDFETKQIEKITKEYVVERTQISPKTYDKKYRIEWYFLPEEAKRIGVIDYIVGVDCPLSEIV